MPFGHLEGPSGPLDPTPFITSCTEFYKKKLDPHFFIGCSPLYPPSLPPPLPLALIFLNFYPHFFYRGPPLYLPPLPPPLPLVQSFKKKSVFFLPHFFYRGLPPIPPVAAAPPTPCIDLFF